MSPLIILNVLRLESEYALKGGLLYVDTTIGGKKIRAMVDRGATHSFIGDREAQRVGLEVAKGSSQVKAVNTEPQQIVGTTRTTLRVGDWSGEIKLTLFRLMITKLS